MARHQSTSVPLVKTWCRSLNCPSAAAAWVTWPAARAEMASAPPAIQWSPHPATQFAQVEPGGGEGVAGEPENQRRGRGADEPIGAVANRQDGSQHGECFSGHREDKEIPTVGVFQCRRTGTTTKAQQTPDNARRATATAS